MDDKRPPKKPEVVKDILKASASLSLKLSKGSGKSSSCRKFLENLSSSSFFVNSLPAFIKDSIQDPCRFVLPGLRINQMSLFAALWKEKTDFFFSMFFCND